MTMPNYYNPPYESEQFQKILLGVSAALIIPEFIIPFGSGTVVLSAFGFLVSMAHAVFLFTRYPTVRDIPWQSWVMYGLSLVPSGYAISYGLRVAGPHVFVVAFVVLFLVFSVVFSWRRNWLLMVLQLLLIGVGLVAVPVNFAVQDRRALARTIGANQFGHLRFLLALGGDVSGENSVLLHAALGSIEKPGSVEMMRFLLDQGADPNAADSRSTWGERISITPILEAVVYRGQSSDAERMRMMQQLLERGANPNRENSSALFAAVSADNLSVITLLIQHGANVQAQDEHGQSPLFVAKTGRLARYLVEHGARLDVRDNAGQTALFAVAQNGDVSAVAYLIEQGMDVNARRNDGVTPLIAACDYNGRPYGDKLFGYRGHEVVQWLLIHDADIYARDNKGRTAFDVAREHNYQDVVALLEAALER